MLYPCFCTLCPASNSDSLVNGKQPEIAFRDVGFSSLCTVAKHGVEGNIRTATRGFFCSTANSFQRFSGKREPV